MNIHLGQKAKHKDLYHGREVFEVIGIKANEVLLKGKSLVDQELWVPTKGLILQNTWGAWIDKDNDIDFTKGAGPRD